jgi:hypothetical protein
MEVRIVSAIINWILGKENTVRIEAGLWSDMAGCHESCSTGRADRPRAIDGTYDWWMMDDVWRMINDWWLTWWTNNVWLRYYLVKEWPGHLYDRQRWMVAVWVTPFSSSPHLPISPSAPTIALTPHSGAPWN